MDRYTIQRFEILGVLGGGGMGTVYRARDPRLDREVAIKVLAAGAARGELSAHDTVDLRASGPDDLLSEARMMARLSHPNVLPIFEVGLDGDTVFLVMEYIEGENLRSWAAERPADDIVLAFAQAARGLAAAHARGIVHRDFKPDNVLIGTDGRARVCDFGLGLIAPTRPSMVRVADTRGTPRYMAPELRRGEPATARSDVFALCTSIAELVDGRALPGRLRAVIAAGTAPEPDARPALAEVIDGLERRPRTVRRAVLASGLGLVAVAALAAAGIAFLHHDDEPCDDVLAGQWDAGRGSALVRALTPRHSPSIDELARRIVAAAELRAQGIARASRAVCEARRSGELGANHAGIQGSCVARRAIELGGLVRWLATRKTWDLGQAQRAIEDTATEAACSELTAPPLSDDRTPVIAVWDRLLRSADLAADRELAELAAIEAEAERLGEIELTARAALSHSRRLRYHDQLGDADAAAQKAYRLAVSIHADAIAAIALTERTKLAAISGDLATSRSYAQLALDLADKPAASPALRAQVSWALGHADKERGDTTAAIARLRATLDVLARGRVAMPRLEAAARFDIATAMLQLDGQAPAALAFARETSAWAQSHLGELDIDYGVSLDVVAMAIAVNGDPAGALPYRRRALAVLSAVLPPEHSRVLIQRNDLAEDLLALGDYPAAGATFREVLAASERNEGLRSMHANALHDLGMVLFRTGRRAEGLRMIEQAVDESISQVGADHRNTLWMRLELIDRELDVGRLDDAERNIAALEDSYRRHPEATARRLAELRGDEMARLAIARGHPREGEALSRAALATFAELHGSRAEREYVLVTLGRALLAQRRSAEARVALDEAIALATARKAAPDVIAELHALRDGGQAIDRGEGARR